MTDRELLELAAKAAGLEILWSAGEEHGWPYLVPKTGNRWNPLTDDGDALRLAVKLGFVVNCWLEAKKTWAGREDGVDGVTEMHSGDPLAATRRAIVRAAAEIGKEST